MKRVLLPLLISLCHSLSTPTVSSRVKRSWFLTPKAGSIANLKIHTTQLTSPPANELRVRVAAIGLNFADVFTAQGLYKAAPSGTPFVPGLEFSGVVEELGVDASGGGYAVGDRVMGFTRFGGTCSLITPPFVVLSI